MESVCHNPRSCYFKHQCLQRPIVNLSPYLSTLVVVSVCHLVFLPCILVPRYAVSGHEDQWDTALASNLSSKEPPSIVSLARSKGDSTTRQQSSLPRQAGKTKKHHKLKRLKK